MRRSVVSLACALAAIAVAPQSAAAHPRVETRSTPPAGLRAGETWTVELLVHASAEELAAAEPPTVLIHNEAAGWTEIRARPVPDRPGAFAAAVTFPTEGTWTYHVHDPIVGGSYQFEPIVVAEANQAVPLWAVAALMAPLLVAAALIARLRQGTVTSAADA
jgi:hypothetical protein